MQRPNPALAAACPIPLRALVLVSRPAGVLLGAVSERIRFASICRPTLGRVGVQGTYGARRGAHALSTKTSPSWIQAAREPQTSTFGPDCLDRIPVTSPARTVVDVAVYGSQADVDHAMESMQRMGHCTIDELEYAIARLAGPGRRGSKKLKLALGRQGGRERFIDSKSNSDMRSRLVEAGLPEPQMEFPVIAEGSNYSLDLAYPRKRIAIECVSVAFHLRQESYDRDTRRRNALLNEGWIVLEFTWQQIYHQPDDCVATVAQALRNRIDYLAPD